ncbi:MAG TPA: hypothetical protein VM677_18700 [Actinokineospora sp.]|nr:hypothetical protein [Actinokineospora sp.]
MTETEQLAEQRAAIAEAFSAPGRHRAIDGPEWPTDDPDPDQFEVE